jgi:hypothetical protein
MKSLSFAVEFKSSVVIMMSEKEVRHISIGDATLGFIAINKDVITPFTAAGELVEVACAAKALFSAHTGIPCDDISLAEAEEKRSSQIGGMLMAAMMQAPLRESSVNN